MQKESSRRLVIDASVVCTCGEMSERGRNCRDFLDAMLAICHRLVVTEEIKEEWNRHMTKYFRQWLCQMYGRKKHSQPSRASQSAALRNKIKQISANAVSQAAMLKDCHLLEAALATDRVVVSLDDTARRLFGSLSGSVGELRRVAWVNPAESGDDVVCWLQNGATPHESRCLCCPKDGS